MRCQVNGDCGVDELCVVESKSTKGCCRAPKGRDWEGFQEENCVVVPQSGHSSNSKKGLSRSEKSGLIALAVIVGCICALFLLWLALRLRQKYVMLRESARMHETTTQLRLAKAIASPAECRYTVCFLSYRDFREAGSLRSHERERRRLVMLDSYDDVVSFCTKVPTVFVSHQWLGRKHPDPRGVHYAAIIAACDEMCKQKDVDPAKLYLWVDYVSVSPSVLRCREMQKSSAIVIRTGPAEEQDPPRALDRLYHGLCCRVPLLPRRRASNGPPVDGPRLRLGVLPAPRLVSVGTVRTDGRRGPPGHCALGGRAPAGDRQGRRLV